jgi:hypothetical protein
MITQGTLATILILLWQHLTCSSTTSQRDRATLSITAVYLFTPATKEKGGSTQQLQRRSPSGGSHPPTGGRGRGRSLGRGGQAAGRGRGRSSGRGYQGQREVGSAPGDDSNRQQEAESDDGDVEDIYNHWATPSLSMARWTVLSPKKTLLQQNNFSGQTLLHSRTRRYTRLVSPFMVALKAFPLFNPINNRTWSLTRFA